MNDKEAKREGRVTMPNPNSPLMYIVVIGFHHNKGCQVEFVHPMDGRIKLGDKPDGEMYKLPKNWKHLPSLALPDGSHNYDSDYIYFHLEDDQDDQIASGKGSFFWLCNRLSKFFYYKNR